MKQNLDNRRIQQIIQNATFSFSVEGFYISNQTQRAAKDILSGKVTASEVVSEITKQYSAKMNNE